MVGVWVGSAASARVRTGQLIDDADRVGRRQITPGHAGCMRACGGAWLGVGTCVEGCRGVCKARRHKHVASCSWHARKSPSRSCTGRGKAMVGNRVFITRAATMAAALSGCTGKGAPVFCRLAPTLGL